MESYNNIELEIRPASAGDLEALKVIWKRCFGDEENYIDLYFKSRDWLSETLVLFRDGKAASMLTMIPTELVCKDGERQRAAMLFAIATHPDDRKQGFAEQLIEYANQYLKDNKVFTTLLVPAGEALFRYYERCGYRKGFYIRETILNRDEILMCEKIPDCRVFSISPEEYNQRRRKQLAGHDYLDYRDGEIAFQKTLGTIWDSDLLAIEMDDSEGCAYYERISAETVLVKEILLPDRFLVPALIRLSEQIPFHQIILRTPAWCGEPKGGKLSAFGMVRTNEADYDKGMGADHLPYLGIAYD